MKKTFVLVSLGLILGATAAFAASRIFSDVPTNEWYAGAVQRLSEKGIIAGYSDGSFRPGNNVNRAEVAVMLDRVIEYIETGKVIGKIAFDSCGSLSTYQNQSWFATLNIKYAAGDYMTENVGTGGDACLSLDGSFFILIPEDFAQNHGCGKIFSYETKNNVLKTPSGSYCAVDFGQRIGDHVQFTGQAQDANANCVQHTGKYYFKENRVEVSTGTC